MEEDPRVEFLLKNFTRDIVIQLISVFPRSGLQGRSLVIMFTQCNGLQLPPVQRTRPKWPTSKALCTNLLANLADSSRSARDCLATDWSLNCTPSTLLRRHIGSIVPACWVVLLIQLGNTVPPISRQGNRQLTIRKQGIYWRQRTSRPGAGE